MSREIKFRAWNDLGDGGEMVTEENSGLSSYQILERFGTVMQYTGLKDIKGAEIYEGGVVIFDLVDMDDHHPVRYEKGVVKFGKTGTLNFGNWFAHYTISVTVVGNIHENPDLIKK